ncbi:hypothetical protein M8J76_000819 [Diaphorina citri]|nr:hypothetical protein M8J76_000819 [Diaphorina citri]
MLLKVLRICHYCGTFPYKYDDKKKQFVFSKLGFAVFIHAVVCSALSLSDVLHNYKTNGGIISITRFVIINMIICIEVVMMFSIKSKMDYFNKVLTLYYQDNTDTDTSLSFYFFIYYGALLISTLSDFINFWFQFDRLVFIWRLSSLATRILVWSVSFQFVAVSIFMRKQFQNMNRQLKELFQDDFKNPEAKADRLNKFSYKSNEFYSSYNSPNAYIMAFNENKNYYTFPENDHRKEIVFINICRKYKTLKANVKELNQLYSSIILFLTVVYLEAGSASINGIIKTMALTTVFTKYTFIKLFYFLFRALRSIALLMFLYQTCSSIEDEVLRSAKIILDSNLKRYGQSFLNLIVSFLHNQHVDKTSFTILFGHISVNLELSLLFMAGITPLITICIQTYYYTKIPGKN